MIAFPNAKINLGLHVIEKRRDGFHNIESCFFPVSLSDILEIIPSKKFSFTTSGLVIPGENSGNLVVKAYELLGQYQTIPNVSIHLHKEIPMGAGLGGGSSDGAFALSMLNELFQLNLSGIQLSALASQLGSDCPFFLQNTTSISTGTGTSVDPFELDLSDYRIELKFPKVHVSTQEAYSVIQPKKRKRSISEILKLPVHEWQRNLINDFEEPIVKAHPEIGIAKQDLINQGAIYASMTGSGSTVFGLFKN